MGAVEQFAVLDGVDGQDRREVRGAPAVPAGSVAGFGFERVGGRHGKHDNIGLRLVARGAAARNQAIDGHDGRYLEV